MGPGVELRPIASGLIATGVVGAIGAALIAFGLFAGGTPLTRAFLVVIGFYGIGSALTTPVALYFNGTTIGVRGLWPRTAQVGELEHAAYQRGGGLRRVPRLRFVGRTGSRGFATDATLWDRVEVADLLKSAGLPLREEVGRR